MNQTLCFQPNMHENVIFHRFPEVSSFAAAIFCSAAGDLGIEGEPRKPQGIPETGQELATHRRVADEVWMGPGDMAGAAPKGLTPLSLCCQCLHPHTAAEGTGSSGDLSLWVLGQGQAADLCNIREAEDLDSWFQGWSAVDRQAANSPTDKQPKPPRQQKYKGGDQ